MLGWLNSRKQPPGRLSASDCHVSSPGEPQSKPIRVDDPVSKGQSPAADIRLLGSLHGLGRPFFSITPWDYTLGKLPQKSQINQNKPG